VPREISFASADAFLQRSGSATRVRDMLGANANSQTKRDDLMGTGVVGRAIALRHVLAALRRAARERGGPLPSIVAADALLDERRALTES
jgi:hypothetical protein